MKNKYTMSIHHDCVNVPDFCSSANSITLVLTTGFAVFAALHCAYWVYYCKCVLFCAGSAGCGGGVQFEFTCMETFMGIFGLIFVFLYTVKNELWGY